MPGSYGYQGGKSPHRARGERGREAGHTLKLKRDQIKVITLS
jgi:hypothetical protein